MLNGFQFLSCFVFYIVLLLLQHGIPSQQQVILRESYNFPMLYLVILDHPSSLFYPLSPSLPLSVPLSLNVY
jgi:hypothetical protein